MANKTKTQQTKGSPSMGSLVWFDIPAQDLERASKFYGSLFGWNIQALPGRPDYWHIDTGGGEETPDGALCKSAEHPPTNYISVASIAKAAAKVKKLGGVICVTKTAVAGMGYFAICQDTEKNVFALWELNSGAK